MDRKSIIFILGLTLIFFVMHQWFDYGTGVGRQVLNQPQTEIVIKENGKFPAPLSKSQMEKFRIVKFYKDIDLKEFATYAIEQNESFVTLAWDQTIPHELFTKLSQEGAGSVRRVELRIKPESRGDPVLYSFYPLSKIRTPWIPDEGSYLVHFLFFDGEKAFLINGTTESTEELVLDAELPQNALGLFEFEGVVNPYSFYDKKENQLNYLEHYSHFGDFSVLTYPEKIEQKIEEKKQNYYVLENEFQQIVFTDLNGDISEINLPFSSEQHPKSVVRPIQFDKTIKEDYPANAQFPLYPYRTPESGKQKISPKEGGYYPLLRRSIVGAGGDVSTQITPYYHGFNIFEDETSPEAKTYQLKRFEKDLIEFELLDGNRRIVKTFSFPKAGGDAPYVIDLSVRVEGDARGLLMNVGIPEVELISGSFNPTLKYRIIRGQKAKVEEIKAPKEVKNFTHISPDWVVNGNGFFGIILDPLTKIGSGFSVHPVSGELVPTRLSIVDAEYSRFRPNKFPGYGLHVPLPSRSTVSKFRIFAGPFDKKILTLVDKTYTDPRTGGNPNYSEAQSYHGWFSFISLPFAKFLFILMSFFYKITHSWGISIILLTVALRLMLFPLNSWSMKSMAKMKEIGPKVKALEQKYKNDPQREKLEAMQLYKREGVNPLGGCFPTLIQLPFLFGMFDLLKSSFSLRGVTFIPGWINNLTAPDVLFSWSYPIPFVGNSFHLLPILLGFTMFMQQKISSATNKTGQSDDQARQQKFMGNMMTIVFTALFYHFPSGLNIYWISSTLLGILQQWMINRKMAAKVKSLT